MCHHVGFKNGSSTGTGTEAAALKTFPSFSSETNFVRRLGSSFLLNNVTKILFLKVAPNKSSHTTLLKFLLDKGDRHTLFFNTSLACLLQAVLQPSRASAREKFFNNQEKPHTGTTGLAGVLVAVARA